MALRQRHRATLRAVVSDYHLGKGRTGISLLREMSIEQPSLVLVLTSASVTPAALAELSRTLAVHSLLKPYHYIQLLRLLRSSLDATPPRRLDQMGRAVASPVQSPPDLRLDR